MMKKLLAGAGATIAVLAITIVTFVHFQLKRGAQAAEACSKVTVGMSREEAVQLMGPDFTEAARPDEDGSIALVYDAPIFAETVPVLHLDPKTGIVRSVECQK
jgi:hypothetical protein